MLNLVLWNKLENWRVTHYAFAIIQDYTITQVPKGLLRMTEKPWFPDKCIIYANSFAARKVYIPVSEETFIFSISYHREHSNYNSSDIWLLSSLALPSPTSKLLNDPSGINQRTWNLYHFHRLLFSNTFCTTFVLQECEALACTLVAGRIKPVFLYLNLLWTSPLMYFVVMVFRNKILECSFRIEMQAQATLSVNDVSLIKGNILRQKCLVSIWCFEMKQFCKFSCYLRVTRMISHWQLIWGDLNLSFTFMGWVNKPIFFCLCALLFV